MATMLDVVNATREILLEVFKKKYNQDELPEGVEVALGHLQAELESVPLSGEDISDLI